MGGASSRAAGRSYKAAKDSAAKAVAAAAREEAVAHAAAPASASAMHPVAGAAEPAAMPRQDVLHPKAASSQPSPTSQQAGQRQNSPLGHNSPAERDEARDYVQASMLDQLAGAITRHDSPQPGSGQVPAQQQRPREKDTRSPFSIADLKTVMETAQQAALRGRQPDVRSLAARYKVDEATLARALAHTSLPLVRKDEHSNMFAVAAAPGAAQPEAADRQSPAAEAAAEGTAQSAAGPPPAKADGQQRAASGSGVAADAAHPAAAKPDVGQQGPAIAGAGQGMQRLQEAGPQVAAGSTQDGKQIRPASWV